MWQARAAFDKGIVLQVCSSLPLSMFTIGFEADVANFSANLLLLWRMQLGCLCGFVLFWATREKIHQFHPGNHYFVLDLGRLNLFSRKATVLCLKMTQKHGGFHVTIWQKFPNRESTGDCGQINHLPSKIQFSESHCGTFYLHFFFSVTWVKLSTR